MHPISSVVRVSMRTLAVVVVAFCATVQVPAMAGGAFPTKPLHLVIPFAPGGPTDGIGRILAKKMSIGLGQPVVVDNRPGAGGAVALELIASEPADGYAMVLSSITLVTNPVMLPSVKLDPVRDFAPVTVAGFVPHVLVVSSKFPAKTLAELVALAQAKPNSLNYGSSGIGTSAHLASAMFAQRAGIQMTHVPFKGSAPALTSLLAGRIQCMFLDLPTALPYLKSGALRALAIAPAHRSPALPDVPTIAESGYPGFDIHAWYGVLVRSGTPPKIVERLYTEVVRALNTPEMKNYMQMHGIEVGGMPSAEFGTLIKEDVAGWRTTLHQLKIGPE